MRKTLYSSLQPYLKDIEDLRTVLNLDPSQIMGLGEDEKTYFKSIDEKSCILHKEIYTLLSECDEIHKNEYMERWGINREHELIFDNNWRLLASDIENDINNLSKIIDSLSSQQHIVAVQNQTFNNMEKIFNKKNFIVHGHDKEAKTEVALFAQELGLEPIILHQQENQGMTIIEKIEKYTDVGYAIVLYTPCDEGRDRKKTVDLQFRARQNVVFEHGYLIGRLGRKCVSALVKGTIETPGDITGVVYETMDDNGLWKIKIAKELRALGFDIDLAKLNI